MFFKKYRLSEISFILFYSILIGIFTIFALSFIGFIFHISINIFYPILGILTSFITLFILEKKNKFSHKHILCTSVILAAIYIISLLLAGHFYDYTFDGRYFRQLAVIFLGNGWNPITESANQFANGFIAIENIKTSDISWSLIWVESYTKFMEILSANFFVLTNHIECGKTVSFLSAFSLFFYSFHILNKKNFSEINIFIKIILSLLFVLNPIIFSQLVTYVNDGLVCIYFILILFALIDIETDNDYSVLPWSIILMSSVILINIKFGGYLYFLVTILIYCIYLCIFKQIKRLKKTSITFIIIILLGLLSGINPYITNVKQNHHFLYPLAGKEKIDVVNHLFPMTYWNKSALYKYFISTFSATNYPPYKDKTYKPKLKLPFFVYKHELQQMNAQTILGGFGVFWSGILLLSILLAASIRYKLSKDKKLALLIFTIIIALTILNPYSWWARHSAHQWMFPIFASLFAIQNNNFKKIAYLIILIMIANSIIFTISSQKFERTYRKYVNNIENKIIKVYALPEIEASIIQKFKEKNVDYKFVTEEYYKKIKKNFIMLRFVLKK